MPCNYPEAVRKREPLHLKDRIVSEKIQMDPALISS
jgi:hypothetical protein